MNLHVCTRKNSWPIATLARSSSINFVRGGRYPCALVSAGDSTAPAWPYVTMVASLKGRLVVSGTRFLLRTPTLGVVSLGEKGVLVKVPAGSMIELVNEACAIDHMVNVRWQGKVLSMFATDVQERGEQVLGQAAD